jgi:CTP:molybdopterin cytidylyltransferase MocA
MLAAVILSGGASQRMGSPKALLPYRGQTFLQRLLEVSAHPKIGERRIVLGPHADAIRAAAPLRDADVVVNPDWEKGQLSSIHAALRSLPPNLDGIILFLIDHPAVSSALVSELIARFYARDTTNQQSRDLTSLNTPQSSAESPIAATGLIYAEHRRTPSANTSTIVLPTYNGKRGHPVIFSSTLFPELFAAPIEQGARAVVWAHKLETIEVPTMEAGCLLNVNDDAGLQQVLEA